ncbi:MAG TPA: hypothetical protein VHT31_07910 [Candidatus Acidoferrum sp.]|nr:hypothetical protein [Candidatus Acidoferrum sp.]
MKFAKELEASLREFASAGAAELCENGGRLAPLSKLSWEVRGPDDKPLLHIWSEQYNLTRRVIAITDHSDARLVLAVERFGRLYRGQAERWLELLVRNDVTRVDSVLDSRFVYAQVFAGSGGEHGILDVLTITRSGRLAILELKATEHIHLSLQAADYWLRVRRHLESGEFRSYGYFPVVEIQKAPPLVYLVAPALRFHPVTSILLESLSLEIEVVRVGLTENWRRSIRVVMRQ